MDKEDVVYIYNGILLNHRKEQNNAICSNMDGPKNSKSGKERQERQGKTRILYQLSYEGSPFKKKKVYIHIIYVYIIYITESFCYIAEINATLTYFI